MKNILFALFAFNSQAMKVSTLVGDAGDRYPGEPYRPPYLEKVANDLNDDLHD